jgi:predicted nuclease of restriction endonuclease-like (RecB) superfamily
VFRVVNGKVSRVQPSWYHNISMHWLVCFRSRIKKTKRTTTSQLKSLNTSTTFNSNHWTQLPLNSNHGTQQLPLNSNHWTQQLPLNSNYGTQQLPPNSNHGTQQIRGNMPIDNIYLAWDSHINLDIGMWYCRLILDHIWSQLLYIIGLYVILSIVYDDIDFQLLQL